MSIQTRRLRLAAGAAAVLVAGVVVVMLAIGGSPDRQAAQPAPATATAGPTAGDPPTADPGSGAAPSPEPGAGVGPTIDPDDPDEPGNPMDATPAPQPGVEVPPAPETTPDPALPESAPVDPLLAGPAPQPSSAQNAVVDGFPAGIPVVAGSSVTSSDVTAEDERVRASLTATTPESGDAVLAEYDETLAGYGFAPATAPAVGGSTARAYTKGAESITLTVTDTVTGGSSYSVLAFLLAAE